MSDALDEIAAVIQSSVILDPIEEFSTQELEELSSAIQQELRLLQLKSIDNAIDALNQNPTAQFLTCTKEALLEHSKDVYTELLVMITRELEKEI